MSELKDKVWIFTFEYAGIVKVGGLGEVPANQAKNLTKDFEITVFIPSHGQLPNLKKNQVWEKLPFNCVGQINPLNFGLNEVESNYNIAFYCPEIESTFLKIYLSFIRSFSGRGGFLMNLIFSFK